MHAARLGRAEESLQALIGAQDQVTADGTFSWIEVECLGACVNAPMVQINADYYEDLTADTLTRILNDLAAGKTPKPGPQIDRQNSAPVGGDDTLTDPSLYTGNGKRGEPGAALTDSQAKKPGEAANIQELPMPTPPIATQPSRDANNARRQGPHFQKSLWPSRLGP